MTGRAWTCAAIGSKMPELARTLAATEPVGSTACDYRCWRGGSAAALGGVDVGCFTRNLEQAAPPPHNLSTMYTCETPIRRPYIEQNTAVCPSPAACSSHPQTARTAGCASSLAPASLATALAAPLLAWAAASLQSATFSRRARC
jgi:hypothetical protein